ncbi:MAG: helix-turn-helix domain containing protein [Clostridioides sp.]|jgi:transposase|nr:helix-turn-helix domain containing protein [Clostridioides sp.]
MNDKEKNDIVKLRNEGYGYKKISNILGISPNTIKSFCRKNNLSGVMGKTDKERSKDDLPVQVKEIKQSELDYRLSKIMLDYLEQEGLLTEREGKAITSRLVKRYGSILGILEEQYGK